MGLFEYMIDTTFNELVFGMSPGGSPWCCASGTYTILLLPQNFNQIKIWM